MSLISQAKMYWNFAWGLRNFLSEPITPGQSQQIITHRLKNREKNLLVLVKKSIYENERSPYLKLLKQAGCQYGDFERMVLSDGVESTLKKLSEAGVYITIDEFKGKKEVRRGGKVFQPRESDFDNLQIIGHLESRSSGSRSAGTSLTYNFDFMTHEAFYWRAILDANDAFEIPFTFWLPILPGSGPLGVLLLTKADNPPIKWFSPVEKRGIKPSFKNRFGNSYIVYAGRLFGAKLPGPEYVPLNDAFIVAQWIYDIIQKSGGCCMNTYPSAVVRICEAAKEKNLDMSGAKFLIGGEPLTQTKLERIESTGATARSLFWFTEAGFVGAGCPNSTGNDMHLLKDSLALIQHQREVSHAGVSVDAFLFTSLLPSTPKVLFNVESGDCGVVDTRDCGCQFDGLGLTDHVSNVSGFDKLTGEGMTFVGTDLVRIIEDVLPSKFGGASTDYQLLEEEDEQGHTHMSVVVNPDIGAIDENELIQTVITELERGSDAKRMMAQVWSQAGTLRVKRITPFTTGSGKLLPLHIQKSR